MRVITLWQPWATLVHIGAKPFEFRSWRPPERLVGTRIVNHAAARPLNMNDVTRLIRHLESDHRDIVTATCLHPEIALPYLRSLRDGTGAAPLGVGLGSFELGEPRNGVDIARDFGLTKVNDSERDFHANWGWPVLDYEAFDEPIEARGRQGLWTWPEPADAGFETSRTVEKVG